MTWLVELQNEAYPIWHDARTVVTRNITGASGIAGSVIGVNAFTFPPGVLRYRIEEINEAEGEALVSCHVLRPGDYHHPSVSGGIWHDIGGVFLSANVVIEDEFEVGYGYMWDSDQSVWQPTRAFGILIPGYTGKGLFVRLTNDYARPQIYCQMGWSNNGPSLWQARLENGVWQTQQPIILSDNVDISGLIDVGNTCTLEFQPNVPETADSTYNMVMLTLSVVSADL